MMKWTDIEDIVDALSEAHPDTDPKTIRFTELRRNIMELKGFEDEPSHCNERILEAVQMKWIEFVDEYGE